MIISTSRQFIFVHLTKCAGTSVKTALNPHLAVNDLVLWGNNNGQIWSTVLKKLGGPRKHSSAQEIRDFVGLEFWTECYSFSVVRPPVERLLSYYKFLLRGQSRRPLTNEEIATHRATGKLPRRRSWFGSGARAAYEADDVSGFALQLLRRGPGPLLPQAADLAGDDGNLLVTEAVRMDRLEADWQRVQDRLGLVAPLARHNVSHLDGDPTPDLEARDRIAEVYARDYEVFGFTPGT